MKFYDMHVPSEDLNKTAELAKALGWSGLVFTQKWNGAVKLEGLKKELKKISGIDCSAGVLVDEKNIGGMQKRVKSIRRQAELVIVRSGNLDFNREVLEIPEPDILSGSDIQINHVMAGLARKNNVAIEFNFHDLVSSYKKSRERIFAGMVENAKFIRKYKAPFVITSGAMDPWDIRSPQDLLSFGRLLGFQDPQIKKAMSGSALTENRKRLSGKWIAPGIELE